MDIIAVIGQKGGTGKTTTAVSLAVIAAEKGKRVAVIDIDTQPSATDWHDLRRKNGHDENTPVVVSYQAARLSFALDKCREADLELVIIDTPGKSDSAMIDAMQAAQLVLLPIRAQMFDLRSLEQVRRNVRAAGDKLTVAVLNAAPIQGNRHKQAEQVIAHYGFTLCPVILHQRAAFADAPAAGLGPTEYDPEGKAAAEITALYSYINTALEDYSHE
jgi:chromosome partitioning protein